MHRERQKIFFGWQPTRRRQDVYRYVPLQAMACHTRQGRLPTMPHGTAKVPSKMIACRLCTLFFNASIGMIALSSTCSSPLKNSHHLGMNTSPAPRELEKVFFS